MNEITAVDRRHQVITEAPAQGEEWRIGWTWGEIEEAELHDADADCSHMLTSIFD